MKIKKITGRIGRDFWAIYVCEHCGHEYKSYGYDDANFHQNVIPNMECPSCGRKADNEYKPLEARYPEEEVI